MAVQADVNAIIAITYTGDSVRKIASYRPKANIYAFTPNKHLLRQLSLVWGVQTHSCNNFDHTNDAVEFTLSTLFKTNKISNDELVVSIGTLPMNKKGSTNMVKFSYYHEDKTKRQ